MRNAWRKVDVTVFTLAFGHADRILRPRDWLLITSPEQGHRKRCLPLAP